MKKLLVPIFALLVVLSFSGCAGLQNAITNAQRLQFKLGGISAFTLAGVGLSNYTSLTNINPLDLLTLTNSFTKGQLPVNFTLDLIAKNPNDGTGGTTESSAIIKQIDWRLLVDEQETINGVVGNSITIPGVGQTATIPIQMSFDLMQFFKNGQLNNLVNLAMALGGKNSSASRLTLKIKPTVSTFLGPISYPGEINVIDKEFRAQ
ncbi:MAG TPA: hypothetical protein PK447_00335 [Ignavibacteria bacterium]|nr:hypothetical protein [Ignavibacteria bacterium]